MDRSTRSLLMVSLLVIAVFLAVNYVVKPTPPAAWWPVLALVSLAVLIWALGRRTGEAQEETTDVKAPVVYVPPPPAPAASPTPAPVARPAPQPAPAPVASAPPPKVEVVKPAPVVEQPSRQETPPMSPAAETAPPPRHAEAPPPKAPPVPEPAPAASPEPVQPTSFPADRTPVNPPAKTGKPDDLTVIEGIGPKMSAALVAAGVDTYEKLAKTPEDALRGAVEAAGMRLAPTLPTWGEQAAFAVKGDWEGLKAFQDTLKGGRKSKK